MNMRLIFMGTPEFAVPALQAIHSAGHEIIAVFTQPDRPSGRKQVIIPTPVKTFAVERRLTVYQPTKIKTAEARAAFEPIFSRADAAIVAAYGRILPAWMLASPRLGCINVHSSLLPRYRGAAPINWAIARGESVTGVTIMQMDEGLDTGPILLQQSTPIGSQETAPELTARLSQMGAQLIIEALDRLARGDLPRVPQNDAEATHAPILKREDGLIDWQRPAAEIFNHMRGFTPFPGSFTFIEGRRLEILRASAELETPDENSPSAEVPPGTILDVGKESFTVQCGGATRLRVTKVQPEGKREMTVRDFLNGTRLEAGMRLG